MQKYINNVQDTFGNAVESVTVTIRTNPGGVLATIFSDNAGSAKANPFTNDSDGEFFFYAADGRYDIELTGPITETKSDIRLLDVLTTGTTLRINTDINTATPPTTEAVTGEYQIYDLADNDILARFGFAGASALFINNFMRGGDLRLKVTDASGNSRIVLDAGPDGTVDFYNTNDGVKRLALLSSGRMEMFSNGNTDTENRFLVFAHADGTDRAQVGHRTSNDVLSLKNMIHGGAVELTAENNAGAATDLYTADPDGAAHMYYAGESRINTRSNGQAGISASGNTDTEDCRWLFLQANATAKGSVGYVSNADIRLRNSIHGGGIVLEGEDSGGTLRTVLDADPDSTTILRGRTSIDLQLGTGGETAFFAVPNGAASLYYDDQENLRTSAEGAVGMGAEVRHQDDAFYPVGMNIIPPDDSLDSGNITVNQVRNAKMITYNTGTARTLNFADDSAIDAGAAWALLVGPSAGVLTGDGGTGVQIRYWNGTGWTTTAAAGNITIGVGQYTIWKETDTLYWISGPNLS